ncbi:MAG: LamG domain-containing protein [Clostridiales Family XIII bacterium]|jgi:hypothetical protein|nr:LamG domain-containing protein [Clostridiales Family XIII bacterium]
MINRDSYLALRVKEQGRVSFSSADTVAFDGRSPFTLEAWIRPDRLYEPFSIIKKNGVMNFFTRDGLLNFRLGAYSIVQSTTISTITRAEWNHVAISYDGSRVDFFVNGIHGGMTAIRCSQSDIQDDFVVTENTSGMMRSLRLYKTALSLSDIQKVMYSEPVVSCVADIDFTQNPPLDKKTPSRAVTMHEDAEMTISYPALALSGSAYAAPAQDRINPGGWQLDSYTVQTTILVDSTQQYQTIYCNGPLEEYSGVALYLEYDPASSGFTICSVRGSNSEPENILYSRSVVKPNEWVNIAVRFDGLTHSLFVDGALDDEKACDPIPLCREKGDFLIGACRASDRLTGAWCMQGYMSYLTIWATAIPDEDILRYMTETEDTELPDLVAYYDFSEPPARNMKDGAPVSLIDMAALREKTDALTSPAKEPESSRTEYSIAPELLAQFRDEVDFDALKAAAGERPDISALYDELRLAGHTDITKEQYSVIVSQAEHMQIPLFHLTRHTVDGDDVLIVHLEKESYVAYRGQTELSNCTMWWIRLVFIVLAGIISIAIGVKLTLTEKATSIIVNKVLTLPAVQIGLAAGALITADKLFSIFESIYRAGALRELVFAMLEGLGFWALLSIIANIFQWLTGSKWVGLLVILGATVYEFVNEYRKKPADCDPPKKYVLSEIRFCTLLKGSSSLKMRKNYQHELDTPEWTTIRHNIPGYVKGGFLSTHTLPVAYTEEQLKNHSAKIDIKVVGPLSPAVGLTYIRIKATTNGILGDIDEQLVPLDTPVNVALNHSQWPGVGKFNVTYHWQYQTEGGAWTPLAVSDLIIYAILGPPTEPWETLTTPWSDAMDIACAWARTQRTPEDAAGAITRTLHEDKLGLKQLKLTYWSTNRYHRADGLSLGKFVQAIMEGLPESSGPEFVNCTTCARAVTLFSNLLGCNLTVTRINRPGRSDGVPYTNIKPISKENPEPWELPGSFRYHDIAFQRGVLEQTFLPVYDACLKVDGTSNPWDTTTAPDARAPLLPGHHPMQYITATDPKYSTKPYEEKDSYLMRFLPDIRIEPELKRTQENTRVYDDRIEQVPARPSRKAQTPFTLVARSVGGTSHDPDIIYAFTETYLLTDDPEAVFEVAIARHPSSQAAERVLQKNIQDPGNTDLIRTDRFSTFTKDDLSYVIVCTRPEDANLLPRLEAALRKEDKTKW